MRFWTTVIVAGAVELVACTSRRPVALVLPDGADPAAVFATVRRWEDGVRTLRARFTATVHRGADTRQAEGVLLVKKPDRFRLRLVSLFGLTVLDYTAAGEHARMELPLEGKRLVDAEIASGSAFSPAEVRDVFLRGDAAGREQCTVPMLAPTSGLDVHVECTDRDAGRQRWLSIDRATATIRHERLSAAGRTRLDIDYDDYRPTQDVPLPYRIMLVDGEHQVSFDIAVQRYEVNPVLGDDLFDVPLDTAALP